MSPRSRGSSEAREPARVEAFSDGVSSQTKNWLDKIKKMAKLYVTDEEMENVGNVIRHCIPRTKEEYFYRKIFDTFYKNAEDFIPDFWMPKWSPETIDPSARTLTIYNDSLEEQISI